MNFSEIFVWAESDFDGTHFIAAEWYYRDDTVLFRQFGTVVVTDIDPFAIEDLFPIFNSHDEACAALRQWVSEQGAL